MKYSIALNHLNEGHAAMAFVEKAIGLSKEKLVELKKEFTYTCHTPVEAGHDRIPIKDMEKLLEPEEMKIIKEYAVEGKNKNVANLTLLAMNNSERINAVAEKHGEVTRLQFPAYKDRIQVVTNGVHTFTWLSASFVDLFDKYKKEIGDWKTDPKLLKNVLKLKTNDDFRKDLFSAHISNKKVLAEWLRYWQIKKDHFTICWARRIAPYKRVSLILQDPEKLVKIAKKYGPIQIFIAGKAHPKDDVGFAYLNDVCNAIDNLTDDRDYVKVIFLENYDTFIAKWLTSSVDVWLNNPIPPFEASGTSGMKAILNGVLQLSTNDGWIVEAKDMHIGRIFGYEPPQGVIGDERDLKLKEDSNALYDNLEQLVALYYQTYWHERINIQSEWIDIMINCIAASGFFNTHRMMEDYNKKIWDSIF